MKFEILYPGRGTRLNWKDARNPVRRRADCAHAGAEPVRRIHVGGSMQRENRIRVRGVKVGGEAIRPQNRSNPLLPIRGGGRRSPLAKWFGPATQAGVGTVVWNPRQFAYRTCAHVRKGTVQPVPAPLGRKMCAGCGTAWAEATPGRA